MRTSVLLSLIQLGLHEWARDVLIHPGWAGPFVLHPAVPPVCLCLGRGRRACLTRWQTREAPPTRRLWCILFPGTWASMNPPCVSWAGGRRTALMNLSALPDVSFQSCVASDTQIFCLWPVISRKFGLILLLVWLFGVCTVCRRKNEGHSSGWRSSAEMSSVLSYLTAPCRLTRLFL